eukprot:3713096-Prymnesium_polylepis.1
MRRRPVGGSRRPHPRRPHHTLRRLPYRRRWPPQSRDLRLRWRPVSTSRACSAQSSARLHEHFGGGRGPTSPRWVGRSRQPALLPSVRLLTRRLTEKRSRGTEPGTEEPQTSVSGAAARHGTIVPEPQWQLPVAVPCYGLCSMAMRIRG